MLPMNALQYTSLIKGQIVNESHGRYIKILRDLDIETKWEWAELEGIRAESFQILKKVWSSP